MKTLLALLLLCLPVHAIDTNALNSAAASYLSSDWTKQQNNYAQKGAYLQVLETEIACPVPGQLYVSVTQYLGKYSKSTTTNGFQSIFRYVDEKGVNWGMSTNNGPKQENYRNVDWAILSTAKP